MSHHASPVRVHPLIVRLATPAQASFESAIQAVLVSFERLEAAVLATEALGDRAVTFLRVNTPRPGEIADLILQLGRVGDVAVVTQAELADSDRMRWLGGNEQVSAGGGAPS